MSPISQDKFSQSLAVSGPTTGIVLQLADSTIASCNRAAEEILGMTLEQMLDASATNLPWQTIQPDGTPFPPERYPAVVSLRTGEPCLDTEMGFYRPDGSLVWLKINAQPLFRCHEDKPYAVVSTITPQTVALTETTTMSQDLRDRIEAEAALRESEERLQIGVQVAGVGLARFDYATSTVLLSPEAAALYGIPPHELTITRARIHDTFHPEEREMLEEIIRQVLDPAGPGWFDREHRVVWTQGEVRWLNVRKQVFFDRSSTPPRPDYAILAAIDITERKQAEAERERLLSEAEAARAIAEAANREKDDFVSVVAHELRSPLNSVAGWAKLLQNRSFDPVMLNKALDTIVRNTEVQVRLIDDLLDIARMVRGTLKIEQHPTDMVNVVEAALNLVRPQANLKQLQLTAFLPLSLQVAGDQTRLQQIVVNLLTNAIKFTPIGGRIEVELMPVSNQMQLSVSDTGKGITADFLPFIFERYQQGQQNIGKKDGLGLGLAIVKHLVELHAGRITVDSPGEGQGATFTVHLPLLNSVPNQSDPPQTGSEAYSLAGVRVLLVDDEPDQVELLTFVLKQAGATVQSANGGNAAFKLFSQSQFDIIVSDIAMPDGDGYELLQQIRATSVGNIPAIALTAYSSTSHEEMSRQVGFQQYLTKPLDPDLLVSAIICLIQGR